ncbi:MAG: hypothetical protein GY757_62265, partial [bacterium]|nr:hypothetical protein [bacterium]
IIGMFVNMLPIRNRPERNKTAGEFLAEVKQNALHAFKNQDYQFDDLVAKLGIKRELNRNPVFDTQFTFQNLAEKTGESSNIKLRYYEYKQKKVQFEIFLNGEERINTIALVLKYLTALFKKSTIEKMANHYLEIVRQVVENEKTKIHELKISHDTVDEKPTLEREKFIDFSF